MLPMGALSIELAAPLEIKPVQVHSYSVSADSKLQTLAVFSAGNDLIEPIQWQVSSDATQAVVSLKVSKANQVELLYQPEPEFFGEDIVIVAAKNTAGQTDQLRFTVTVKRLSTAEKGFQYGGGKLLMTVVIVLLLFVFFRLSDQAIRK